MSKMAAMIQTAMRALLSTWKFVGSEPWFVLKNVELKWSLKIDLNIKRYVRIQNNSVTNAKLTTTQIKASSTYVAKNQFI